MSFTGEEISEIQAVIDQYIETFRPREEIRDELDYECQIEGQSVILYEVRPVYFDPTKFTKMEIAKATYTKNTGMWKIYWMRASGRWEVYPHVREVSKLSTFFIVVKKDEYHAFFG